jgi:transcriptional regulator with XRE-family HTH domain
MTKRKTESFGTVLKSLRSANGYSIKTLAEQVEVNYTYLSKLENGHSSPSEDFIERIATFFNYDKEELMVRAGKIPEDILEIVAKNPKEALRFLRKEFGG